MDKMDDVKWTNEKHRKFLSLMEATFVKTMLERSSDGYGGHRRLLRLDRYVPDVSESTLDSKALKRRNNYFAEGVDGSNRGSSKKGRKTTTKTN
ncbi:hypothetical protein Ancab_009627 [Ancistrocladus abbreviatus]